VISDDDLRSINSASTITNTNINNAESDAEEPPKKRRKIEESHSSGEDNEKTNDWHEIVPYVTQGPKKKCKSHNTKHLVWRKVKKNKSKKCKQTLFSLYSM